MIWMSTFAREKINKLGKPGRARSSARAVRTRVCALGAGATGGVYGGGSGRGVPDIKVFFLKSNYSFAQRYISNSRATMGVPSYCPICAREELFFRKANLPNDFSLSFGAPWASFYPFARFHRRPDIASGGGGRRYCFK